MAEGKPTPEEGKGTQEKTEVEATEAKATTAKKPAAKKPAAKKPAAKKAAPRKAPAKKAAATAAEETGVGKEEAEAAEKAPSGQKKTPAARTRARDKAEAKAAPETPAPATRVAVRAQARYVRTSARKARLVCDHIRGKSVEEAFAILAHTPRHVAEDWRKLLQSAVANAEHNHELVGDDLRISAVNADEGPTLKRFRPRAQGRATRIRKRTSHLTITLTPKD